MASLAQATLDALPEHICLLDGNGVIVLVNRAWLDFARANGLPASYQFVGQRYLDAGQKVSGPGGAEAEAFRAGLLEVLSGRRESCSLEYPCHAPTAERWFQATATRYHESGQLHVAVSHADITSRRAAVQETTQLVSLFIRHSPIFAYIKEVTPGGCRVLEASENFEQMIGVPGSRMVGKTNEDLFPPALAASITADDRAVVTGGRVLQTEEALGGRSYRTLKFPITLGSRTLLAGYTIDLSEQRRAEAAHRALELRLRQARTQDSLAVMAAGIAHQFNNLLVVIQGYLELARERPGSAADPALGEAEEAARRAAAISGSLLSYLGQGARHREPRHLGREVAELLPRLRAALPAGVRLEVALDRAGDLPWTSIDPAGLEQVVLNLVTNAGEALATRGGLVQVSVYRGPPAAGQGDRPWACLEIRDDGPGMDAETQERVFDPFFTTHFTGRGLGLPVALGIVRGCGGTLEIESAPGRGTAVLVRLPASAPSELPAPPGPVAAPAPPPQRRPGPGAVLVVEDDQLVVGAYRRLLARLGRQALVAPTGAEALELLRARAAEVGSVVLDLNLPGLGGWQVLAALRRDWPELFVVVASGHDVGALRGEPREVQPDAWLQKPFTAAELARVLAAG